MPAGNAAQPGSAPGQRALEQPDTQGERVSITLAFESERNVE